MNRQPIEDVVAETGKTIGPTTRTTRNGSSAVSEEPTNSPPLPLKRFWISARVLGVRRRLAGSHRQLLVLIFLPSPVRYQLWNRRSRCLEKRSGRAASYGSVLPAGVGSVLLGAVQVSAHGHQRRWRAWLPVRLFPLAEEGRFTAQPVSGVCVRSTALPGTCRGDRRADQFATGVATLSRQFIIVLWTIGGAFLTVTGATVTIQAFSSSRRCCTFDRERLDGRHRAEFRGHFRIRR
jgi:putative ATP-binding cassette transporter